MFLQPPQSILLAPLLFIVPPLDVLVQTVVQFW